jgi:plasmid maintenance system antidote protein VapI
MERGITTSTTVSIYRRNLQRAYIVRMEYLKEEIKSTRSADYYNVAQSDVRALVRGELTTLKTALAIAKK